MKSTAGVTAFGVDAELRDSSDLRGNPAALSERLGDEGYVLLRGVLDVDAVLSARRQILELLAERGAVDAEHHDLMDAIAGPTARELPNPTDLWAELGRPSALQAVTHEGTTRRLMEALLGGDVTVLPVTWLRATPVGKSTGCHVDSVYMKTPCRMLTAWTPIGDVPLVEGSLMILEGSQRLAEDGPDDYRRYADHDVTEEPDVASYGIYSFDPASVGKRFGLRWLSTDYRAGDLLIFTVFTMHASLDNRSPVGRIRLTSDTRYQPATEPLVERFAELQTPETL